VLLAWEDGVAETKHPLTIGSTFQVDDFTGWAQGLTVEVAGRGVVSDAGAVALRALADRSGLTAGLSAATTRRGFVPVHDRGRVLSDLAVAVADGARVLSDLAVLRHQGELFGPVASGPTLWRTLDGVDAAVRDRVCAARARVRRHVWDLIAARHGGLPASPVADGDLARTVVIRLDATLVISHSDKEQASATFKHTWGLHPLTAWCDNTGESLAAKLRPGSAGSNTTADHLDVLTAAIAQIPSRHRRDLLITCDGAGATKDLLHHITGLNRPGWRSEYSVGFDLDARARAALLRVPASVWQPALDEHGRAREVDEAAVVELTGLLRESSAGNLRGDLLKAWPADMRVIVRRERPHPGAQLSLFEEADGYRYQLFATNTPLHPGTTRSARLGQIAFLEARHRAHARVEDCIRNAKNTGLGHLPSANFEINQAWLLAAGMACDLLAWLRLLTLDGDLARAEPKTLRYRLLHVAARLVRGQRRRKIRIPITWPWADDLSTALRTALNLPRPA
jgi:hypothetical protein